MLPSRDATHPAVRTAGARTAGNGVEDALPLAIDAIQLLPRILQARRIVATGKERGLALGHDLIESG